MKELLKKDGELKIKYQNLIKLLSEGEKKLYLKYYSGTVRYRHTVDTDYYNMKKLLDGLNIKYKVGNDAPRGGATGDYILILADRRNSTYKKILDMKGGK